MKPLPDPCVSQRALCKYTHIEANFWKIWTHCLPSFLFLFQKLTCTSQWGPYKYTEMRFDLVDTHP